MTPSAPVTRTFRAATMRRQPAKRWHTLCNNRALPPGVRVERAPAAGCRFPDAIGTEEHAGALAEAFYALAPEERAGGRGRRHGFVRSRCRRCGLSGGLQRGR